MAILVTGGSKGIGRAVALDFASRGDVVFVNYHSDDGAARAVEEEIRACGGRPHLVKADVGTPEGAQAALAEVAERVDRLDQLVHCAVDAMPGAALEVDPVRFTQAVHLNGLALLYLTQAALPLFGVGSTVLFVSSRGSRVVVPGYAAIGPAKAFAESLIRYLAVELAPRGVRANAVSPGALPTEALQRVAPERLAAAAAASPSGRNIDFEDVTALVAFLASPAAQMIQGQVVAVDGGLTLG